MKTDLPENWKKNSRFEYVKEVLVKNCYVLVILNQMKTQVDDQVNEDLLNDQD